MNRVRGVLLDHHRLGRFASVGLAGASLDITLSGILVLQFDVAPELAKFIGAECAIVVMFLINDRWTFLESNTRNIRHGLRRLLKSNLVRSGGILTQLLVVFFLARLDVTVYFGATDIWPVLTMPIAIAAGFLLNYVGETLFTWRAHRQ